MTRRLTLGFIGLGLMGTAMSLRLLGKGWTVNVWNLEPERVGPVANAGAIAKVSPADVTEASDIVLMCVLNTQAVESCVFGSDGVAQAASAGKILIDHSTIDPASSRGFAERLRAETGMAWIDAPVSGGPIAARQGQLTIMAGGDAGHIAVIAALMSDLAANFTHIGPAGAGQAAKMINQAIVGTTYVLMAEALVLAEAAGIDAARLPQCLAGGHADGTLLQQLYPRMQARAFDPPLAYARQLLKDMVAVQDDIRGHGLDLPLIARAIQQHRAYVAQGNDMADPASIVRLYEQKPSTINNTGRDQ
jgi:3-hydroxyisobutyrate dehydrogenase-like beta-hydroxyacid dehydrogenase